MPASPWYNSPSRQHAAMSAAGHHGVCENDYMHIAGDPKFQKMLASNSGGNERLIFSIIGVKVNRKGT